MESVPEALDTLIHDIMTLQIEERAMKKEHDELSKKRLEKRRDELASKQDEEKKFEVQECKRKRSLSQNSYCWLLINKIANILRLSKEEIYLQIKLANLIGKNTETSSVDSVSDLIKGGSVLNDKSASNPTVDEELIVDESNNVYLWDAVKDVITKYKDLFLK